MTDTNPWIGIVSGLAGLMSAAVAGIAVLATSRHATAALREQRTLLERQQDLEWKRERANRLWDKRADVYVDLLAWLRAVRDAMFAEGAGLEVPPVSDVLEDRLAAFASDEIIDRVVDLRRALLLLAPLRSESLARRGQDTTDPGFDAWRDSYVATRDKAVAPFNSLWDSVRRELNPEPRAPETTSVETRSST